MSARYHEHRSREPVHLGGMDGGTRSSGYRGQHGRERAMDGQCVYRAVVAEREIRGDLPAGIQQPACNGNELGVVV